MDLVRIPSYCCKITRLLSGGILSEEKIYCAELYRDRYRLVRYGSIALEKNTFIPSTFPSSFILLRLPSISHIGCPGL